MTYLLGFFIISIFLFILSIYLQKGQTQKQIDIKNNLLKLVNDVKGNNKRFINPENTKAIVLDESNKKVYLFSPTNNIKLDYNFDDIIQSEVIVDGNTITSTNRGSQLMGMVVGGILAGGVGAIVGGLSGGKTSKDEIKNIELKLTINNMNNSIFKVNFLPFTKVGWSKDSTKVKNSLSEIETWQGYFDIILKQQNNVI
jgi:hypothetical protein